MDGRSDSEVLIVGGGLVGASLALALDRAGIAATLIEARAPAGEGASVGLVDPLRERYLALARASVQALTALGVMPMAIDAGEPIRAVHVSRRGDFGRLLLRAREHGVDQFGMVVPASRLGAALAAGLQRCRHLQRLAPARLLGFEPTAEGVLARIDGGAGERSLRAPVLVGADGADSSVRTLAGLGVDHDDYGQDALVCSVGLGRDHGGMARERFTDDGAIAVLPLPGRRAGVVWTVARARAEVVAGLPDAQRLAMLQEQLGQVLGRLHDPGRLVRYPLQRTWTAQTVAGRAVVIGNAAQSLHPIAAQGFNLGLRDALVLAEELAGLGLGEGSEGAHDRVFAALRRHGERRRHDRERIAALSHRLARWPKLSAPGLGVLRSAAFAALNLVPAAREALVLAAMGYGEQTPALCLEDAA